MQPEDLVYYNAFNQLPQIGPARFARLLAHFPSLKDAWRAPGSKLLQAGLEEQTVETIVSFRPTISPDEEMAKLRNLDITLISRDAPEYPRLLGEIHNAPNVLYVRGNPAALALPTLLAIVGTRKISPYGKQVTPLLVRELAAAGAGIVSGLAFGIDAAAHYETVAVGGVTIAVLGSGIDDASIYPHEHRGLAQQIIASSGAIISELPLGAPPLKLHFPYRNRIIAGMSRATIVIEADERSGALITAQAALEYNRDVFAVPGSILNPVSRGPNTLIKQGAQVVTSANDILQELDLALAQQQAQARTVIPSTPLEARLLALLASEPVHVNVLIASSGLPAPDVSATLTMMELKGLVKNVGAMQYVKTL